MPLIDVMLPCVESLSVLGYCQQSNEPDRARTTGRRGRPASRAQEVDSHMSLLVVLVRHGKAEPGCEEVPDEDRDLTDAGRNALRHSFSRTFSMLDLPVRTEAWVSPARRARETARLVMAATGCSLSNLNRPLYEQNTDELLRSLSQTDNECTIVVGHVPCLERACARLCGEQLDFQPGAVCAIEVPDDARRAIAMAPRPVGRLAWFVQGPEVGA